MSDRNITIDHGTWNPLYDLWVSQRIDPRLPFDGASAATYMSRWQKRDEGNTRYAWAIPSPQAAKWIAERCPRIVEVGAGRGYWAKVLSDAGCDVVAYEPTVENGDLNANHWFASSVAYGLYFPVECGDHQKAWLHPDRTLMLCWPPYDDGMASEALAGYRGEQLLYVGEGDGGCCGDDRFWKMVSDGWEEAGDCNIPQWPGMHDYVTLYRRK